MNYITNELIDKLGIEGVKVDLLPKFNHIMDSYAELKRELELEKVKNAEQIKIIEAMVRGLRS